MAAWQSIAIVTALSTCLVILISTSIVSLIAPSFTLDQDELEQVSGYYGPGSTAAWLLLAFSNHEFLLYGRLMLRYFIPEPGIYTAYYTLKVDSTIIGTAAYSLVALGDLFVQLAKRPYLNTKVRRTMITVTFPSDGLTTKSIQAPLAVMYLTSALSSAALIPHFFYFANEVLIEESVSRKGLLPFTRRRKLRLAFWALMYSTSQLVISNFAPDLRPSIYGGIQDYVCFGAALIVVLGLFLTNLHDSGRLWSYFASAGCFFLLFCRLFVKLRLKEELPCGIAWPQSAAKFSDLDQAAAVGVALVGIGASMTRWLLRRHDPRDDGREKDGASIPTPIAAAQTLSGPEADEIDVTDAARILGVDGGV